MSECRCECGREIEIKMVPADADALIALIRKAIRVRGGDVQAALGTARRDVPPAYTRNG